METRKPPYFWIDTKPKILYVQVMMKRTTYKRPKPGITRHESDPYLTGCFVKLCWDA